MTVIRLSVILAVTVAVGGTRAAQVPAVRVLASNGVKAALEALQSRAEARLGRPLAVSFATSASTRQRIAEGADFDVAILTTDVLDALTQEGKVAASPRAALGKSGIGIGVRAGATRPDIRTPDALKRSLSAARSLTWASDGASRPHIAKMLEVLGIADEVNAKTVLEQGSVRATGRVARGETEMVITLVSEILPIQSLQLVGPVPDQFQTYVSFAAAPSTQASNADAARTLIAYLSATEAQSTFKAKGID